MICFMHYQGVNALLEYGLSQGLVRESCNQPRGPSVFSRFDESVVLF